MLDFTKNVIQIISAIPEGKVMTYGQIANIAGSPRGARQVSRILHSMSRKHQLPWHRVINAQGQIVIRDPAGFDEQKLSLEAEEVEVSKKGYVDLEIYRWNPDKME